MSTAIHLSSMARSSSSDINYKVWRVCAWSGIWLVIGQVVGFCIIAGFLPPPAASLTSEEVYTFFAAAAWLASALHFEEKTVESVKVMYDLGWMWYNPTVIVSVLQLTATGLVILLYGRQKPLYPGWMSWFTFAIAFSFLFAFFTPFVRTGPLAWNGLLCFWLALGLYFVWFIIFPIYTVKAINTIQEEETAA